MLTVTATDFLNLLRTVAESLEQQPGAVLNDGATREELQHLRCLIALRLNETADRRTSMSDG